MKKQSAGVKLEQSKPRKQVCHFIKGKPIFKNPVGKFDMRDIDDNVLSYQSLNYFNYGFNKQTMQIYVKLMTKTVQRQNTKRNPIKYVPSYKDMIRLNDEVPMDLGGFCSFLDKRDVEIPFLQNFDDGQQLLKYFVMTNVISNNANRMGYSKKEEYGILNFVKSMYPTAYGENNMSEIMQQIDANLQRKYKQLLEEELKQKDKFVIQSPTKQKSTEKEPNESETDNFYEFILNNNSNLVIKQQQKQSATRQQQKEQGSYLKRDRPNYQERDQDQEKKDKDKDRKRRKRSLEENDCDKSKKEKKKEKKQEKYRDRSSSESESNSQSRSRSRDKGKRHKHQSKKSHKSHKSKSKKSHHSKSKNKKHKGVSKKSKKHHR